MKIVPDSLDLEDRELLLQDKLCKKPFAESLIKIIHNNSSELVLSINGEWGVGKTTFVKQFQYMLDGDNALNIKIPNIYIDAFESDYVDDPFMVVVSSIYSYIKNLENDFECELATKLLDDFKDQAKKVGKNILSMALDKGISAFTGGVVNKNDITAAFDTSSAETQTLLDKKLDAHIEHTKIISVFNEYLSVLPEKILNIIKSFDATIRDNSSEEDDSIDLEFELSNHLVIIIDELDRCRPPFALEMLEKIKHIFSAQNIVFVLVMNSVQMEESIRSIYGSGIDASVYLQKFVNFDFNFPVNDGGETGDYLDVEKFCKLQLKKHEIESYLLEKKVDGKDYEYCEVLIVSLVNQFDLTLRKIEKIISNFVLLISQLDSNFLNFIEICWFVSFVKVYDSKLFNQIVSCEIILEDIYKKLDLLNKNYNRFDANESGNKLNIDRNSRLQVILDCVTASYVSREHDFYLFGVDSDIYCQIYNEISKTKLYNGRLLKYFASKLDLIDFS